MSPTDTLLKQIASAAPEAVLEAPTGSFPQLQQQLEAQGYFVTLVDRAPVFDKTTLLHALYQSCEMPGYFGFNYDALLDSLSDFSWKTAKGYVLVFKNFGLLEKRSPQDAGLLLEIVKEARAERDTPLWLVLLR